MKFRPSTRARVLVGLLAVGSQVAPSAHAFRGYHVQCSGPKLLAGDGQLTALGRHYLRLPF